jgi:hypothetical protein
MRLAETMVNWAVRRRNSVPTRRSRGFSPQKALSRKRLSPAAPSGSAPSPQNLGDLLRVLILGTLSPLESNAFLECS